MSSHTAFRSFSSVEWTRKYTVLSGKTDSHGPERLEKSEGLKNFGMFAGLTAKKKRKSVRDWKDFEGAGG